MHGQKNIKFCTDLFFRTLDIKQIQNSCKELIFSTYGCKDKAFPLQAWAGPEGSRRFRLPDFRQSAHEGGKVVGPTHRLPLPPPPPRKYFRYSFLLEAESTPGP